MDIWLRAVDRFYNFDLGNHDDDDSLHNIKTFQTSIHRPLKSQTEISSFECSLARLLLFLAGCSLDAGKTTAARGHLTYGLALLRDAKGTQHEVLVDNMLMEYVASFQEEEEGYDNDDRSVSPHHVAAPAFDLLQCVIDSSCLPLRRSSPFYRAPHLVPQYACGPAVLDNHPGWCKVLEDHFDVIRDELDALLLLDDDDNDGHCRWPRVGDATHRDGAGSHDGSVVSKGSWNEIVLFGSTGGRPELAPKTSALIDRHCQDDVISLVQAGAGEVILSLLQPRTRIEPHTALHNLRLTAHLGLIVPQQANNNNNGNDDSSCYLQVAGQRLHWKEGTVLVFDDAYEHSVVNDTDEIRVVLLLRFWHPMIPKTQREAALESVLESKKNDQLRRFNPPIPHGSQLRRGMEKDSCSSCGESGYSSIRLLRNDFRCMCGAPINP